MDLVAGRTFAEERRPIRHLDPVLLLVTAALVVIGLFLIYSATNQTLRQDGLDPFDRVNKQVITMILGLVLMLVIATFDYRFFKVYAGFIFGATLFLLLLVHVPGLSSSASGTSNYIDIPGAALLQLSPSEFAKIGLIVMLAAHAVGAAGARPHRPGPHPGARRRRAHDRPRLHQRRRSGPSIVLVAITVGMLVVAGTRLRHLLFLAAAAILLIFLAFQLGVIKRVSGRAAHGVRSTTRRRRPTPGTTCEQSEIAVGSGGTCRTRLPERHRRRTWTTCPSSTPTSSSRWWGRSSGSWARCSSCALFALLLWRAIRIAFLSKDPFGTYVAVGIASMFAIQIFVNVGMVIGIMPITGIPLPFLSYGGSAMLVNFIAVGMLLNIHMRRFK